MRIGFDISQTGTNKAGCGYVAYSLIRALASIDTENEYLQYPTFGDFYFDPEWKKSIHFIKQQNFHKGLSHNKLDDLKEFWNNPTLDLEEKLGRPDIIHSNNFYCPSGLKKAKLVYFLHDLLFTQEPDMTTESNRVGCFQGVFRASLFADHIITNSEYTKKEFIRTFPHYPEEKITAIHLASRFQGLHDVQIKKLRSLEMIESDQFWFNVGTLEPRKNQIGLLKAYARLKKEVGEVYQLVIAGGKGWLLDHFEQMIHDLKLEDDVIILGYVDDDQLQWLYKNCFAFVYPAFSEGFGLPVLEAMSLGAAVITSNTTSLPEVVGDAGIMVDPGDFDTICEAMRGLLINTSVYEKMKIEALECSEEFSWENVALKTLNLYKKALI